MKCPFWLSLERRTSPRFDSAGKKIGDDTAFELVHEDCQKTSCPLYEPGRKTCSIPDADRRQAEIAETLASALPARIKSDVDASLFEKTEMLSVVFSTGITHLEDALKGYHAQLAKTIESAARKTGEREAEIVTLLRESRDRDKALLAALTRIASLLDTIGAWAPAIDSVSKRGEVLEKALVDVVTFLTKTKK